jgi:hypothetical protein
VEKRFYRSRFSRFLDQIWVAEQLQNFYVGALLAAPSERNLDLKLFQRFDFDPTIHSRATFGQRAAPLQLQK